MTTKITRDILEGFLYCKFKGHLKLIGEEGSKSDYERLLADERADVRMRALDKILAQNSVEQVKQSVILAPATGVHSHSAASAS